MRAQDLMITAPTCVTPDTSLADAARMMKEQDVGMLPVVDKDGSTKLVGVVTDRDITLQHVAKKHTSPDCKVREAMTAHVATCRADADIKDVMRTMAKEQVRRVPIVDERNALVGIVAQADIALRGGDAEATGHVLEQISQDTERGAVA